MVVSRLSLLKENTQKYMNGTFDGGMSEMSYTLEIIERRSFYTYILANLNGTSPNSFTDEKTRSQAVARIADRQFSLLCLTA